MGRLGFMGADRRLIGEASVEVEMNVSDDLANIVMSRLRTITAANVSNALEPLVVAPGSTYTVDVISVEVVDADGPAAPSESGAELQVRTPSEVLDNGSDSRAIRIIVAASAIVLIISLSFFTVFIMRRSARLPRNYHTAPDAVHVSPAVQPSGQLPTLMPGREDDFSVSFSSEPNPFKAPSTEDKAWDGLVCV